MTLIPKVDCDLWFPTPVYRTIVKDHLEVNKKLLPLIRDYQSKHPTIKCSNVLGYHSDSNIRWEFLASILCDMMQEIEKAEGLTQECELVDLWFNVNPPQSHNGSHIHPRCDWSGVYYVQTPPNSGMLVIDDPRDRSKMILPKQKEPKHLSPMQWRQINYQPEPGLLLFFPSWLEHSVGLNMTDKTGSEADRISLSFNFTQRWFSDQFYNKKTETFS